MCEKTLTPWKNDKWEQCDTKHKHTSLFNKTKFTPYWVTAVIHFWFL